MAAWVMFGVQLAEGIAQLLEAQKNKTAQTIGNDIALIDTVTLAILQKNAEIKGLAIDWSDPAAVAGYVATLPTFVPIPDPNAPAANTIRIVKAASAPVVILKAAAPGPGVAVPRDTAGGKGAVAELTVSAPGR